MIYVLATLGKFACKVLEPHSGHKNLDVYVVCVCWKSKTSHHKRTSRSLDLCAIAYMFLYCSNAINEYVSKLNCISITVVV